MPSRTLESTLAWGLILAWATGAAAQSVDLRPKFTTGRVTYYRAITNEEGKRRDQGRQKSTIEVGFRCTVKDVHPDGSAELEITLLYVAASGGTPQSPLKFDSRRSRGSPSSLHPTVEVAYMLVDKRVVLSVAADGTIDSLSGAEQIDRTALGPFSSGDSPENILRVWYEGLFPTRQAPVPTEVGAHWEDESTTQAIPALRGASTTSIQYTLKSVDLSTQRAKIAMNSVLRWEGSEGAGPITFSVEGESTGRVTWDLAAGELVKATDNGQITMTTTMGSRGRNAPKDPPPKSSIKITRTFTSERVKLEDLRLPADKAKPGRKREGK